MLESHLVHGKQSIGGAMTYGQSVTDDCLGFAATADAGVERGAGRGDQKGVGSRGVAVDLPGRYATAPS